jgi:hypothetical protein
MPYIAVQLPKDFRFDVEEVELCANPLPVYPDRPSPLYLTRPGCPTSVPSPPREESNMLLLGTRMTAPRLGQHARIHLLDSLELAPVWQRTEHILWARRREGRSGF